MVAMTDTINKGAEVQGQMPSPTGRPALARTVSEHAMKTRSGERTPIVLTVDAGGSSLKANASDLSGPAERLVLPEDITFSLDTGASRSQIMHGFVKLFYLLLMEVQQELEKPLTVEGISLAFPGPCDYEQGIPLMQGLAKYEALYGTSIFPDLRQLLKDSLGRDSLLAASGLNVTEEPVILMQNDARMYAYGTWIRQGRPDTERIASLTLGTGCGSAFIAGGKLLTDDARENRAEGLPEDGYIYHRPFRGLTADDWLSTRGLVRVAAEYGIEVRDGLELARAAEAGNQKAAEAFEAFGRLLAEFIESPEGLGSFRPDRIYLGGNLSKSFAKMNIKTDTPIAVLADSQNPLIGAAAWWRDAIHSEKGKSTSYE